MLTIFLPYFLLLFSYINAFKTIPMRDVNDHPSQPVNCIPIDNLFMVNFIDNSGSNYDEIYTNYPLKQTLFQLNFTLNNLCGSQRQIFAYASDDFIPYPHNVTNSKQLVNVSNYLGNLGPTLNLTFDLEKSVTTFLSSPEYSSYDPVFIKIPFANIFVYNYPHNDIGKLISGIKMLQDKGFTVFLIIDYKLKHDELLQYLQILPQSNIMAAQMMHVQFWLAARINQGVNVPIVNQTGMNGSIGSSGYPGNYPLYSLQEYYITAPSKYYAIQLKLTVWGTLAYDVNTSFVLYVGNTMDTQHCLFDYIGITDVHDKRCNIVVPSNKACLRFWHANGQPLRRIQLTWTAVPVTSTPVTSVPVTPAPVNNLTTQVTINPIPFQTTTTNSIPFQTTTTNSIPFQTTTTKHRPSSVPIIFSLHFLFHSIIVLLLFQLLNQF